MSHGHDDASQPSADCAGPEDCSDVIALVYAYLDGETTEAQRTQIGRHLSACGPCLRQYGLEEAVKALVHRSCSCPVAPEGLRMRIITRIQQVRITYRDL
jgi:mycothiol system anti-sigma-R factor